MPTSHVVIPSSLLLLLQTACYSVPTIPDTPPVFCHHHYWYSATPLIAISHHHYQPFTTVSILLAARILYYRRPAHHSNGALGVKNPRASATRQEQEGVRPDEGQGKNPQRQTRAKNLHVHARWSDRMLNRWVNDYQTQMKHIQDIARPKVNKR